MIPSGSLVTRSHTAPFSKGQPLTLSLLAYAKWLVSLGSLPRFQTFSRNCLAASPLRTIMTSVFAFSGYSFLPALCTPPLSHSQVSLPGLTGILSAQRCCRVPRQGAFLNSISSEVFELVAMMLGLTHASRGTSSRSFCIRMILFQVGFLVDKRPKSFSM